MAARRQPGASCQGKWPAPGCTWDQAPGMRAALSTPAPGGIGLSSPTSTPTGTVIDGSDDSSSGRRFIRSAQSPLLAGWQNSRCGTGGAVGGSAKYDGQKSENDSRDSS